MSRETETTMNLKRGHQGSIERWLRVNYLAPGRTDVGFATTELSRRMRVPRGVRARKPKRLG
eukprot:2640574-Lingulodinium_polyedra.AAC.1